MGEPPKKGTPHPSHLPSKARGDGTGKRPSNSGRKLTKVAAVCGDSTESSLESPPEADPIDRDLSTDDA